MEPQSTERAPLPRHQRGTRIEPYLFVVLEGARLDAGGLRIAFRGVESLRIGRGDARALLDADSATQALELPDPQISGTHARIVRNDTELVLEDADSTNGTLVNGEPVTTRVLRDGDVLDIGQTVLLYREIEEPAGRPGNLDSAAMTGLEPGFATLDPNLVRQFERLSRVAPSLLSILILGETGSGKEMLARGLHVLSRRPGPFVAVNCGAIPQNLVESQLFGHVRGAFSGALRDEPGLLRSAQNGTLLLDEIGDLPPSSQAALLRVLQEGEVRPVGSVQTTKVNVRVIAATHMLLEELVERGVFRRDLYARLAGYTFTLPPLRERRVDIGLFVAALISAGKLGPPRQVRMQGDAARALVRHDWRMNVRELEQCLRAAFVLADDGVITVDDLPPALGLADAPEAVSAPPIGDDDSRARIVALLAEHHGNVSAVARALQTSRSQIHRLMARYGISGK